MKKIIEKLFAFISLSLIIFRFPQISAPETSPYGHSSLLIFFQAFDKGNFIEDLTMADLEISLDDQKLKIDGLVLVKGLKVKRIEGQQIASPVLPRIIILEFRGYQYDQKFGQMIEQLFRHPYSPSDTISIVTPIKPYGFSEKTLRDYSVDQLIEAGLTVLKRDMSSTGQNQIDIFQEMTRLILDLPQALSPRDVLRAYQQNLENLKMLRQFNGSTLMRAVDFFAPIRAPKRYIVICQQEFLPIPNSEMMDRLLSHQNTMFVASELFRKIESGEAINVEPLINELISAGIVVDFLYFKMNLRVRPEIQLRELSTDMFDIYSKIARATGGTIEVTSRPAVQLKKILTNLENYYLLQCSLGGASEDKASLPYGKISVVTKKPNLSLIFYKL